MKAALILGTAIVIAAAILSTRPPTQVTGNSSGLIAAQAQGTGGGGGTPTGGSVQVNSDGTIMLSTGRYLIVPLDRMQGNGTGGGGQQAEPPKQ
jgi:hypothetical protein